MVDRRIIAKVLTGSHLYGTNRPESDTDYVGIFLPSSEDLLGLYNCPGEWTENVKVTEGERNGKGDIDCKYFSLPKFLKLAAEGQPGQLELLFAPESNIIIDSPEFQYLRSIRDQFLSKRSIAPFIGFALAQAHKSVVKGDNLNQIRKIIAWGKLLHLKSTSLPLNALLAADSEYPSFYTLDASNIRIKAINNDFGFRLIEVAGRQYDINIRTKVFLDNMKELEGRYGSRSEVASKNGVDQKSLIHTYRLLGQAEEVLTTGIITLPRPAEELEHLKRLKSDLEFCRSVNHFDVITKKIDHMRQNLEPNSHLPDSINISKINELCQKMLTEHLKFKT